MNKRYIVRLTDDERQRLVHMTKSGKTAAYKLKHAHILLQVDVDGPNWSDEHVAQAFRCHGNTVRNGRQRFVEQGLEAALARSCRLPPPGRPASCVPGNCQCASAIRGQFSSLPST